MIVIYLCLSDESPPEQVRSLELDRSLGYLLERRLFEKEAQREAEEEGKREKGQRVSTEKVQNHVKKTKLMTLAAARESALATFPRSQKLGVN